jgi:hypothetical protein
LFSHVGIVSASRKKHFPLSTTRNGISTQFSLPYFDWHQAVVRCASSSGELPGGDAKAHPAEIKKVKNPITKALFTFADMIFFI